MIIIVFFNRNVGETKFGWTTHHCINLKCTVFLHFENIDSSVSPISPHCRMRWRSPSGNECRSWTNDQLIFSLMFVHVIFYVYFKSVCYIIYVRNGPFCDKEVLINTLCGPMNSEQKRGERMCEPIQIDSPCRLLFLFGRNPLISSYFPCLGF